MSRRKNGEGSLFQRKDGYWVAAFWDDTKGRQVQVKRKDYAAALAVLDDMRDRARDERPPVDAAKVTFTDAFNAWMLTLPAEDLSPQTIRTYTNTANAWVQPVLGHLTMRALKRHHVDRVLIEMKNAGKSTSYMNTAISVMRGAFGYAVANGWRGTNPMDGVRKRKNKPVREVAVPTVEETKAIMDAASPELRLLVAICWKTGCRPGEALALRVQDIDKEAGTILFDATAYRPLGEKIGRYDPKSEASSRLVRLPAGLLVEIQRFQSGQDTRRITGWLLCRENGQPVDYSTMARELRDIRPRKGITLHKWRHAASTELMEAGVPDVVAAAALGHSVLVAKRHYQHARQSKVNEAMDLLDRS